MTTLSIAPKNGNPISWGKYGQDLLNYQIVRDSWTRKKVLNGGDYDAVFTLNNEVDIVDFFTNFLGYEVTERVNGQIKWQGFIYEMVLRGTVDMINSYKNIYNSVFGLTKNYIRNAGFETGDLTDWTTSNPSEITIISDPDLIGRGSYSVELTYAALSAYIQQFVTVSPNTAYRFSFYQNTPSDGVGSRYSILDQASADIIPITETEVSPNSYRKTTVDFITSNTTTGIYLRLFNTTVIGETVYYDNITLDRLIDEQPVKALTTVVENTDSIAIYGNKTKMLRSVSDITTAEANRDEFLSKYAYPHTKRGNISSGEIVLDVYVRGYMETFKWNRWTLDTGGSYVTPQTVLDHIKDNNTHIQSVLITPGITQPVLMPEPYVTTQEDAISALMEQLGATYRIYVAGNKQLILDFFNFRPRYFMRDGVLYPTQMSSIIGIDAIDNRDLEPAPVRNLDNPLTGINPNSLYRDRRDFIMGTIEVSNSGVSFSGEDIGTIIPDPTELIID